MKKLIIPIAITLLLSCSKQHEELQPVVKSVTYLLHFNRPDGSLIKTDTSIHWCRVSGEDLKRFEAVTKTTEIICDTYNTLELIIAKPCLLQ